MKRLAIIFLLAISSSQAYARSTTIGVIDEQTGNLIIEILDDPGSAPPYDAAQLWDAIKTTDNNKSVVGENISIKCNTFVNELQKFRFGSCSIEIKAQKVVNQDDGFGALFGGVEGQLLLASLVGSENPDFPLVKELKLAGSNLLITADHQRELFALIIKNELMQ